MKSKKLKIKWPNKHITFAYEGDDWFQNASKAGINIPTGCLTGSCGACEIDVNGETIRPCITCIKYKNSLKLNVEFTCDPFWEENH